MSSRFIPLKQGILFNKNFRTLISKQYNIKNIEWCFKFLTINNFIEKIGIKSINPNTKQEKIIYYCPSSIKLKNKYAKAFAIHYKIGIKLEKYINYYFKSLLNLIKEYLLIMTNSLKYYICQQVFIEKNNQYNGLSRFSP